MEPSPVSQPVDVSIPATNMAPQDQQSPTFSSASTTVACSPDSVSPQQSPTSCVEALTDNEHLNRRLEELDKELEEKQKELKAIKEREHQTIVATMRTIKRYKEENYLLEEDLQRANERNDALQKALVSAEAVVEQFRKGNEGIPNGFVCEDAEQGHSFAGALEVVNEEVIPFTPSRKRTASNDASSPAAKKAAVLLSDAILNAYQSDYIEPSPSVPFDASWQPMTYHYY